VQADERAEEERQKALMTKIARRLLHASLTQAFERWQEACAVYVHERVQVQQQQAQESARALHEQHMCDATSDAARIQQLQDALRDIKTELAAKEGDVTSAVAAREELLLQYEAMQCTLVAQQTHARALQQQLTDAADAAAAAHARLSQCDNALASTHTALHTQEMEAQSLRAQVCVGCQKV